MILLILCFYSKLVRLEGEVKTQSIEVAQVSIQTGAIRSQNTTCFCLQLLRSFYSKLVRLEVNKRGISIGNTVVTVEFLFQTGAIRSLSAFRNAMILLGFYSKLVRLEADMKDFNVYYCEKFLFQTGAIRSKTNPHATHTLKKVSIPNWCD